MDNWVVVQENFEHEKAGHWASIFTISNGYFGSRGVDEESVGGGPSTYIAGTFSEDFMDLDLLPNTPNWLLFELEVNGERFDIEKDKLLNYRREYNLEEGVLYRRLKYENSKGNIVAIRSERFASQDNRHLGALKYCVTPLNFSGKISIRTGFDLDARFRGVNYLEVLSKEGLDNGVFLCTDTSESHITIAETALVEFIGAKADNRIVEDGDRIFVEYSFDAEEGKEYELQKFLSIFTSRDTGPDISKQATVEAECALQDGYESLKSAQISAWNELWKSCDILIEGDDFPQLSIRFCMFHLISAMNPNDDRVSLGAKLLSGDFYRHHVFWDTDLFMVPFFTATLPERARNLVMYRYRTLDGARGKAKEAGHTGAWYPWESSDTGHEVCPKSWIDDEGTEFLVTCWKYEVHSVCDIAYSIWDYYITTGDRRFLFDYGFEILLETARFWVSWAELDDKGSMSIRHVTGPDEYHSDVDNSAYINYLAAWNIRKALHIHQRIRIEAPEFYERLPGNLRMTTEEIATMKEVASKIRIPFDDSRKLFIQFEGFEELKLEDPKGTSKRYTCEEEIAPLQVVKQSDVIMLMYLFRTIFPIDIMNANWDFYVPRTEHNSSLSTCTHSIIASLLGLKKEAYDFFITSAGADLREYRSDTAHGLHGAAMGGTWKAIVFGFAGVIFLDDKVRINPSLPQEWKRLRIPLKWHGVSFTLDITTSSFSVINNDREHNLIVESGNTEYIVGPQKKEIIKTPRSLFE